jgi:hypothetical protein
MVHMSNANCDAMVHISNVNVCRLSEMDGAVACDSAMECN